MDSNISELVKSGHEIASDLKASCGAVDVRSMAQLISDLASQLEVQLVRSNTLAAVTAERDAAVNAERIWEKSMMEACGEDGPASVAAEIVSLRARRDTALESLRQQLAALAAENSALREFRPQPSGAAMMEALDAFYEYHEDVPEQGMMAAFEMLCCKRPKTPATDAFLAEVRAAAVDEVCLKISNAIVNCHQDELVALDAAATICGDFAAQLRKGVQS